MTDRYDIWTTEEQLWTGGADSFQKHMAPGCLMAFPGLGILQGEDILVSLREAPRWDGVSFSGEHKVESDGMIALAYTATGQRDGDSPYRALCTSTWCLMVDGWQLVQHQQSPAP